MSADCLVSWKENGFLSTNGIRVSSTVQRKSQTSLLGKDMVFYPPHVIFLNFFHQVRRLLIVNRLTVTDRFPTQFRNPKIEGVKIQSCETSQNCVTGLEAFSERHGCTEKRSNVFGMSRGNLPNRWRLIRKMVHLLLSSYICNILEFEDLLSVKRRKKKNIIFIYVCLKNKIFRNIRDAEGALYSMWSKFMEFWISETSKRDCLWDAFRTFSNISSLSWALFRLLGSSNV